MEDEEFYFVCELCGKKFPADPDTMLECEASFRAIDAETGEEVMNEELNALILADAKKDPQINPFLKGVICMCKECQEEHADDSDEADEI